MKIGFTGTREGLSNDQKDVLTLTAERCIRSLTEVHHGACKGADVWFHTLVRAQRSELDLTLPIHLHPSDLPEWRANCRAGEGDVTHDPLPPLERNAVIVRETDALIACPRGMEEEQRSGTWSTVRLARKLLRPILIVYPDGTTAVEGDWGRLADIKEAIAK